MTPSIQHKCYCLQAWVNLNHIQNNRNLYIALPHFYLHKLESHKVIFVIGNSPGILVLMQYKVLAPYHMCIYMTNVIPNTADTRLLFPIITPAQIFPWHERELKGPAAYFQTSAGSYFTRFLWYIDIKRLYNRSFNRALRGYQAKVAYNGKVN